MRKYLYISLVFIGVLVSCQKGNQHENNSRDSVTSAKETVIIDSVKKKSEEIEERKRLDSLRSDSLAKINEERKKFMAKIPDPNKILKHPSEDSEKYLKSLGYKGKISPIDIEAAQGTFSLRVGNNSCKMHIGGDECCEFIEATISDKDALNEYYKKAKKLAFKRSDEYCEVSKKGNTVTILYVFNW